MENKELTAVKAVIPSLDGLPQAVIEYVLGLVAENARMDKFVDECLQAAWQGGSLDGGEIQDIGLKHSLLREEVYSADQHESLVEDPSNFEGGNAVYFRTEMTNTDAAIAEIKLPLAAEVDAYRAFVDNLGVTHSLKAPETDHLLSYYEARGAEKMFNLVEPALRDFCNPSVTEFVIEELESLAANLRAGRKG